MIAPELPNQIGTHADSQDRQLVVQRLVRRINRVRGYMEARGFRVGRGTYDPDGMNLATVDIDRLDAQEINGAWTAYDRSDSREAAWAIIVTAREALKRFAPNDGTQVRAGEGASAAEGASK